MTAGIGISQPQFAIRILPRHIFRERMNRAHVDEAEMLNQRIAIGERFLEQPAGVEKDNRNRRIDIGGEFQQRRGFRSERRHQRELLATDDLDGGANDLRRRRIVQPRVQCRDIHLFRVRCHGTLSIRLAANRSKSDRFHGSERSTTSPMMRIAGPFSTLVRRSGSCASVPTTALASGRVTRANTPTGVFGERPAASIPSRMAGAAVMPMYTTSVIATSVSNDQSTVSASWVLCAVRNVMRVAFMRYVSGTSNCAAAPIPAVMPGMTA